MVTIGLFEPDPSLRLRIQEIVSSVIECAWLEIESIEDLDHLPALLRCDFVIVSMSSVTYCEPVRRATSRTPLATWIAVLPRPDRHLATQALRAGCGTVTTAPLDTAFARRFFSIKNQLPRGGVNQSGIPLARGAMVGVWSWLGGVGKTVLAANVASGIGEQSGQPVCLVELTPGPSHLSRLTGVNSRYTPYEISELGGLLTVNALKRLVAPTPYQVGVITAPSTLDCVNDPDSSDWISRLGSRLREVPITSVLDLPSGWSSATQRGLAECGAVVLVTPPDTNSIELSADAWTTIRQTMATTPMVHVALNAIQEDQRWSADAIRRRFHAESAVSFPHDQKTLAEQWKRGYPLLKKDRNSRWRQARDELVKHISQQFTAS